MQTNLNIRMDSEVKQQFDALCKDLGLNMTTAVNIFAKAMLRRQGFPFDITMEDPNDETLKAMDEVKEMKAHPERYKGYDDVDVMFEDLLA